MPDRFDVSRYKDFNIILIRHRAIQPHSIFALYALHTIKPRILLVKYCTLLGRRRLSFQELSNYLFSRVIRIHYVLFSNQLFIKLKDEIPCFDTAFNPGLFDGLST